MEAIETALSGTDGYSAFRLVFLSLLNKRSPKPKRIHRLSCSAANFNYLQSIKNYLHFECPLTAFLLCHSVSFLSGTPIFLWRVFVCFCVLCCKSTLCFYKQVKKSTLCCKGSCSWSDGFNDPCNCIGAQNVLSSTSERQMKELRFRFSRKIWNYHSKLQNQEIGLESHGNFKRRVVGFLFIIWTYILRGKQWAFPALLKLFWKDLLLL